MPWAWAYILYRWYICNDMYIYAGALMASVIVKYIVYMCIRRNTIDVYIDTLLIIIKVHTIYFITCEKYLTYYYTYIFRWVIYWLYGMCFGKPKYFWFRCLFDVSQNEMQRLPHLEYSTYIMLFVKFLAFFIA